MDGLIKFSIIIPIYNVEKYIRRCLNSIINQTYTNLDIILIDDGSPDKCPDICDEYAKKDSRIRVIHKENEGLGMARNTGIENALGDYICFFDSDDFVAENLIEKCYEQLCREKYDVIHFDFNSYENDCIISNEYKSLEKVYYNQDVISDFLAKTIYNPQNKSRLNASFWNKVYSIKIFREYGIRCYSERQYISEDYYTNLFLYRVVKSVKVIPECLYFYQVNDSSLSRSFQKDRFDRNFFQYEESLKICDQFMYPDYFKTNIAFQTFGNILGSFKILNRVNKSKKEKRMIRHTVYSNESYKKMIKSLHIKNENLKRKISILILKMNLKILNDFIYKHI